MSPCSPNDVSVNVPDGPSGPAIPGFGTPFALKLPNINPFPDGFPEDLLELLDKLQLLIPPGALKPQLNPNFGKDVFDAIMKLLDQFMPFLMLYKFFLPILELIICIIEVLCALMNPFKLIRALNRLFTRCIPAFLNLFPIFALICMIISLLLLILALIEYIIAQILKLILAILRNINALIKAFEHSDGDGVLAIAQKLGSLLCMFQNLFVLFAIFNIIIQIIKDILSLLFHIPPCEDGDPSDEDGCCTPDVCPAIVKQSYTRATGTFKYFPQVSVKTSLTLPSIFGGAFNFDVREEKWQLWDNSQEQAQQFRNIFDSFDVTIFPKPIFFPTDAVYNLASDPRQSPYTVDLRLFYDPKDFGRINDQLDENNEYTIPYGKPRLIQFKNCILTNVPTTTLTEANLTIVNIHNGVGKLAGGLGYENDGTTALPGYSALDGKTPIPVQATLENFIHMPAVSAEDPELKITDGHTFFNAEYTFKPNIAPLLQKNIVTLGCVPSIATNRGFINNIFAGDIALKTQLLGGIVNGPNFPNPAEAQECLTTAIASLKADMTARGVAVFQSTADICLDKLKLNTHKALSDMIGVGFDPCKSVSVASPNQQFTTKPIDVIVTINERNGLPLTTGIPTEVGVEVAKRIKANASFGTVSKFTYDGLQSFTATITSDQPGAGFLVVSFENQMFCTNTIPDDVDVSPTHDLQEIPYTFIYAPYTAGGNQATGEGDTDGQPRRDAGDQIRDNGGNQ